jgi:hypothetical protein
MSPLRSRRYARITFSLGAEWAIKGVRGTPSCLAALCERQGQALRALRGLDTAGRRRATGRAGSEGMPLTSPRELDRQPDRLIFSAQPGCFERVGRLQGLLINE